MAIKRCPICNFAGIKGDVFIENGRRIQKIGCSKCGYVNNKDLGVAE